MAPPTGNDKPRLVQIGLNLISLLEVNDKEHYFEGNVLMHIFWDASPMNPNAEFFRPWVQIHNVKSIEELKNDGMQQWDRHELARKVKGELEKNGGDRSKPIGVMETRNFVGRFVSELNLRSFPFDHQALRITVMCNTTADVTFSHKTPRNKTTHVAEPLIGPNKRPITAIKCNLEADTLSEWDVLLQDGKQLQDDVITTGAPALAVVNYDFKEHDKMFSAEGAVYQRLDFYVYVERELKNMMFSIIIPSTMLSFSSLSVFSLDISEDIGDRFAVLFTVILTIVANQFVYQGRLPYLAYFTWLDACLLGLQLFVYAVVVETSICETIAGLLGMTPQEVDLIALYVHLAIFALLMAAGIISALHLHFHRKQQKVDAERTGLKSFDREEARLRKLWFPDEVAAEEQQEKNEIVVQASGN